MNLSVGDGIHLTEFRNSDLPALVLHLSNKDIYERTLRIPHPYTVDDAQAWLEIAAKATQQHGQPVHFAIRNEADELIGGCGFDGVDIGKSHRAEIGYWLAKPYWGRGIMTQVVRAACNFAFAEWGLGKLIDAVLYGLVK